MRVAQGGNRRAAWLIGIALALLTGPALAQAPERSARPLARPGSEAATPVAVPPIPGLAALPLAPRGLPPALRSFAPDAALADLPRPLRRPGAEAPPAPAIPTPPPAVVALAVPAALLAYAPDPEAGARPRPRNRPGSPAVADATDWVDSAVAGPRPRQRSAAAVPAIRTASASAVPMAAMGERLAALLQRPEPRPRNLARRAAAAPPPPAQLQPVAAIRPAPGTGPVTGRRGALCGVPGIEGEAVSAIVGRVQGCGIANPVKVTAVGNIRLSQPATMDCDTARALHSWVERGLKPAFARAGGVTTMQVAGHYVCRTRNHRAGARISEHGKGRAIDISGLTLANGQRLSILRDWRGAHGAQLKIAHRAACGIFGTTLGPGSDGMHEDHLHFDTARHRNGAYCR